MMFFGVTLTLGIQDALEYSMDFYSYKLACSAVCLIGWSAFATSAQTTLGTYLIPTAVLVGIVCNVLTIIVLSRDDIMVRTTSLLLKMLATADLLNILFILLQTSLLENLRLSLIYIYFDIRTTIFTGIFRSLQFTAFTASTWFEVLITAERYVAVCYPLHVSRYVSLPRVRAAVAVIWLLAILFNTLFLFDNFINVISNDFSNEFIYRSLATNPYYIVVYKVTLRSVVNTFLPFALLTFFTVRILTKLSESLEETLLLSQNSAKDIKMKLLKHRRTTVTLTIIVIVFVVLDVPIILSNVIDAINYKWRSTTDFYFLQGLLNIINTFVEYLAYFILVIKSTLNFFIFCLTGKKYRQVLRDACHSNKNV